MPETSNIRAVVDAAGIAHIRLARHMKLTKGGVSLKLNLKDRWRTNQVPLLHEFLRRYCAYDGDLEHLLALVNDDNDRVVNWRMRD